MNPQLYQELIERVTAHRHIMLERIIAWSNIASGSSYPEGLKQMKNVLVDAFASLQATLEVVPLPSGNAALLLSKRLNAPTTILFGGHYDTVYGATLTPPEQIGATMLRGSGVTDMKGGIAMMLSALEIFESSSYAPQLGWQVLLTPDEEIGSPCTTSLWTEISQRHRCALIFEPAYPDGSWVDERKGSVNISIRLSGLPAHSGRDFFLGRSAIYPLARIIAALEKINSRYEGISVNVGTMEGGTATNIVPDKAQCSVNIRSFSQDDINHAVEELYLIVEEASKEKGITAEVHRTAGHPVKTMSPELRQLFALLASCAKELNLPFQTKSSGGCCDGNDIAAAGVAVIDTMGVVGGKIHTPDEYLDIDSLIPRCQCALLLILKIADGDISHT